MTNTKKPSLDPETVLDTLDHIGQAIDAMNEVVVELRDYLEDSLLEGKWAITDHEMEIDMEVDITDMEWLDSSRPGRVLH